MTPLFSTPLLISPNSVEKYFKDIPLNYNPFEVSNVHASSRNKYSITLLSFTKFNDDYTGITIFIYKFHGHFDGLIATDFLDKWEATINYENKTFMTINAPNPIKVYNSINVNLYEDLKPTVRVPINIHERDVIISEQVMSNSLIQDCLTTISNNRGFLDIQSN